MKKSSSMVVPLVLMHMLMRFDDPPIRLLHPAIRQVRVVVMVLVHRQCRRGAA